VKVAYALCSTKSSPGQVLHESYPPLQEHIFSIFLFKIPLFPDLVG
jgi:hypothetical protein